MQFGCCCPPQQSELARSAGFDYIETKVVSLQPEQDDEQFQSIRSTYEQSALPVRACNVFLPGDLKIVGDAVDWQRVEAYVRSALARVEAIGAEIVVFGSGGSRHVPDGVSRSVARDQIVRFLGLAGDAAQRHGLTIAIEPLNHQETNVINSVGEGVEYARRLEGTSVRVLADLYHMMVEDEPLDEVVRHSDWIAHVHVADSGRYAPGTGDYPLVEFFSCLREGGYTGSISVECQWRNFAAEASEAAVSLRRLWQASSR